MKVVRSSLRTVLHAGAIAVILLTSSCSGDPEPPPAKSAAPAPAPDPFAGVRPRCSHPVAAALRPKDRACIGDAAEAGARYLGRVIDQVEPSQLAFVDYVYRRWDLAPLARARERAVADPFTLSAGNPLVRLWSSAVVPQGAPASLSDDTRYLLDVLRCEREPMAAGSARAFRQLLDSPGRGPSDAVLWTRMAEQLGCSTPPGIDANSAVDVVARQLGRATQVTDLSLAQSAALAATGRASRVPDDWTDRVIAAQRPDGSWRRIAQDDGVPTNADGEESRWSATISAITYLLVIRTPTDDPGLLPQ